MHATDVPGTWARVLTAEDGEYQLGAYMKYTIAGEPPLTQWLQRHIVPRTQAEGFFRGGDDVFGQHLLVLADRHPDLVCLTAAMLHPTGLTAFAEAFPDRVFDTGIAEQHTVTCAAGLAMGGLRPVVAVYSTFLTRAVDQVLMDVALHRLPVTFVLDRAGVTGEDGSSHHGVWDLALLRVAGIIECRRDGKHNFYHVVPKRFQAYLDTIFSPAFRIRAGKGKSACAPAGPSQRSSVSRTSAWTRAGQRQANESAVPPPID